MVPFKRSRSPEQIFLRKEKIVKCALDIYDKEGYSGVNFCALSKLSELSRPAIYSYLKNHAHYVKTKNNFVKGPI